MNTLADFEKARLAAFTPAVIAARNTVDRPTAFKALIDLAASGVQGIINRVDYGGYAAFDEHQTARANNYKWIPNILQADSYRGANGQWIGPDRTGEPPAGSIVVIDPETVDLSVLFPAYVPPPPTLPAGPYVGPVAQITFPGNFNWATPNGIALLWKLKDGDPWQEDGHTYARFSYGNGFGGLNLLWQRLT